MVYAIEPVTVADAPGLSKAMMSAMHRDPHWALLFGSRPLQNIIDDSAERLPKALSSNREERRHQKVVDRSTGEIVGYARWILPAHGIEWFDAQVPKATEEEMDTFEKAFTAASTPNGRMIGLNPEMNSVIGKKLYEEEKLAMGDGVYLTLDYLTTTPLHQGKGVAGMLLRSGLAQADAAGMKTFVMSTPAGRGLYEKNGFVTVREVLQDVSKWGGEGLHSSTFLIREPSSMGPV